MKIPIRFLELTQIQGQPYEFQVCYATISSATRRYAGWVRSIISAVVLLYIMRHDPMRLEIGLSAPEVPISPNASYA
jgi:hypothetical protein